jgi:hypothetical protein
MGETLTAPPEVSTERDSSHGITGITVGGFKSIATTQSIEVRPLTVLAGANSSGKTSFLQPLLLLKQTLDAPFDPGPLMLDGPNVKFTSGEQLLSRLPGTLLKNRFQVKLSLGQGFQVRGVFEHVQEKGFQIEETTYTFEGRDETLRENMLREEVSRDQWPTIPEGYGKSVAVRDRCFLNWAFRLERDDYGVTLVAARPSAAQTAFVPPIRSIIHLPGLRGSPERSYPVTAVGQTFAGRFDSYLAGVIEVWQSEGQDQRLARLNSQLKAVGLARTIKAIRTNDAQIELHVDRLPVAARAGADFVSVADVGFGVPTALSVLVALIAARPAQVVYIEQPELHLHPRAQVKLAGVLADAARRSVRVIAETHSSLLIRGVQTLVARGELDPKLVKLHWFSRDQETGESKITSADLDENGAFGEWPMDFDDVELHSTGDYLDAVELRGK